jgi:hypothetical protein
MSQDPTTEISGTRYAMRLLRGRESRTVGLLVTSAILRGVSVAIAKADLSKLLKQIPDLQTKDAEGKSSVATLLASLSWSEISGALGGIADGGATVLEMIGPDALEVITKAFTDQCTVWAPADHSGAGGQVFPVPLSNRDDHWVGKWSQYLQWLAWGVRANGFFPELPGLGASPKPANGSAGGSGPPSPTASA